MISGDQTDYDAWPDMITPENMERLLMAFPTSKLLQLHKLEKGSAARTEAWADLGLVTPMQQLQAETLLDGLIEKLTRDYSHAR